LKILFILEYHFPHIGGVETLFKSLTEELVKNGHEVTVLTNRYDLSLPKEETINGVRIKRLSFRNRYIFTFLAGFAAIKYARIHDLIHTTSYNAAVPAYIAGKITNTKMVITFHEVWGGLWEELPWLSSISKILHSTFEKWILKMKFDRFVAVSDYTKDALISHGVNEKRVTRIYNGVDYDSIKTNAPITPFEKPTFLFFGRAGVSKGIDVLLDAVHILHEEKSIARFILVLPPPTEPNVNKILSIIRSSQLEPITEIKSSLPWHELLALIKSVNAVIIPSYSEGFCFAAAETIAMGTPIISSGRGALSEVIGGKHLEFDNMEPASLASAIKKAIKEEWKEKEVKKFEIGESVAAYIKLFGEVLPVS